MRKKYLYHYFLLFIYISQFILIKAAEGDEDDEELDDIEDFLDLNKYYDELLDRKSGPAFDEELKKLSERRMGPYYDIVGSRSEIKDKNRKSKIIHIE